MNQALIKKLIEMEDSVVPTLFKPVQFDILRKLNANKTLTENEKRYLRGKMKAKLNLLMKLLHDKIETNEYNIFLSSLNSYYVTGLEALKYNGFGWYFKPKIVEIINTRIEGKIKIADKTLKFIRVKSLKNRKFSLDKKTGLKYAANEQIIKDITIIKNEYAEKVWQQMLSRYGNLFVKKQPKISHARQFQTIDYTKYGV